MIPILGRFEKRPAAVRDYKASAAAFLIAKEDTIVTYTVTAEPGITISRVTLEEADRVIRFFVSGGTDGNTYVITVTIVTFGGRTEVGEIELTILAA